MAGSFADAFVGAGIVSEKKAALLEKDKKENKKIDKPKIEQVHESQQKHINEEFTKLWNNEKSHKFIVHLIYSYIPSKGNFAWIQEQLKQKTCCICKCKLVSKDDLISKSGELAKLTIEHMKLSAKNKLTTEQIQSDISKIVDGFLGIVSEETNASFCGKCYNDFLEWIEYMLFSGNNEINKIIRRQRIKQKNDLQFDKKE